MTNKCSVDIIVLNSLTKGLNETFMYVIRNAYAEFHECSQDEKDDLISKFTIRNSEASKPNFKGEETIHLAFEHNGVIYAPRNNIPFHYKALAKSVEGQDIDLQFKGELYDFQNKKVIQPVLTNIVRGKTDNFIKSPCGSGKTVMALCLIAALRKKALVVVPNTDLIDQWAERIEQFVPNASIGYITGSKKLVQDITLCTPMSLANISPMFNETLGPKALKLLENLAEVGTNVIDEAHRLGGDKWVRGIHALRGRYRLSFSATPKRTDGRETLVFSHLSTPSIQISTKELIEQKIVLSPEVQMVSTNEDITRYRFWDSSFDYTETCNEAAYSSSRNAKIIRYVTKSLTAGRKSLILSNRTSQIREFYEHYDSIGVNVGLVVGKSADLPKEYIKPRKEALGCQLIIANFTKAQEGLDVQDLDTAFLGIPINDENILEQVLGRLTRMYNKKTPLLIDFVDTLLDLNKMLTDGYYRSQNSLCPVEKMAVSRFFTYKSLDCKIRNIH